MTEKAKRVAICVPAYGTITAAWFINFIGFILKNQNKYLLEVCIHEDQPVSNCREKLVEAAMTKNPDYILFLDSDNLVGEQTLDRLIKVMHEEEAELVTALYFQKQPPYYPVIREYRSGGFWKIENPPLGQKILIDGCGFGCVLIKPEVFLKVQRPWFKFSHEKWGERDIVLSEDLYFCRQMMQQGMRMVCDTGNISAHVGGMVDVMEFNTFAPIRQSTEQEREELIEDMIEFTGHNRETLDYKMMVGAKLMKDEWISKDPKNPEEIKKFYKETENYLYDLTNWHFSDRRRYDIEIITHIASNWKKKNKPGQPKILDYGCGIGQNAFMLARMGFDVTIADLDSKTFNFAKHRFIKHGMKHGAWAIDIQPEYPEKFDYILAFDVLEHIAPGEVDSVINKLIGMKAEDGEVMMTNTFTKDAGGPNSHPMHFEASEHTLKLLEKLINKKT